MVFCFPYISYFKSKDIPYRIFLFLVIAISTLFYVESISSANQPKWLQLKVKVYDGLTHNPIFSPNFELYNAEDSTLLQRQWIGMNDEWMVTVPYGENHYVLIVKSPEIKDGGDNPDIIDKIRTQGYFEPAKVDIKISDLKEGTKEYLIPDVFLSRKTISDKVVTLDEVTVTASKVKFYNKGDTLIYNADAFLLAEGSTLDALIAQLPGVELKKNGQIFVNGKFVESLLINGKDLFDGQNRLLLQNLPAYTVKDIAVYNREGRLSRLMEQNAGDIQYVMDVRLKRKFRTGVIANIEGGYGTSDRYLARLFDIIFSENFSGSVYATANNLNDMEAPGKEEGAWNYGNLGSGELTVQKGGLNYQANGRANRWQLKGMIDVVHTLANNSSQTSSQNFLNSGEEYSYNWTYDKKNSISLQTSHLLECDLGKWSVLQIKPSFQYDNIKNNGRNVNAIFNKEQPDTITSSGIENIFSNPSLSQNLINRFIEEELGRVSELDGGLDINLDIKTKTKGWKNMLSVGVKSDISHQNDYGFQRFSLIYSDQSGLFNDRYTKRHPWRSFNTTASISFRQFLSMIEFADMFDACYSFNHIKTDHTSDLYMLNQIDGYNPAVYPFGKLPPDSLYLHVKDTNLSYVENTTIYSHNLDLRLRKRVKGFSLLHFGLNIDYKVGLEYLERRMNYLTDNNYFVNRTGLNNTFSLSHDFGKSTYPKDEMPSLDNMITSTDINVTLAGKSLIPTLKESLDYVDTTNPLATIIGNPNLKDGYQIKASMRFSHSNFRKQIIQNGAFSYSFNWNEVVQGVYYDISSGHITYKPYNSSGNWILMANYSLNISPKSNPSSKFRPYEFSTNTSFSFSRYNSFYESFSNGLIPDFSIPPGKRGLNIINVDETLRFLVQIKKSKIGIFASATFDRYLYNNMEQNNFNVINFRIGPNATFNFPFNWTFTTDLILYRRAGYIDKSLNTTNFVWNLRLSKSFINGKLLLVLDGYDLLHQLTNIDYIIDSHSRSVKVSNTIPHYVLLHIKFNFGKLPK